MADGGTIHRTKEKDNGTYCAAKISFMIVYYVENKSFFFMDKNNCPQRDQTSLQFFEVNLKKLKNKRNNMKTTLAIMVAASVPNSAEKSNNLLQLV